MLRLFLLFASAALPQLIAQSLAGVQASLTMDKQNFLVGEPIVLTFTARYTGTSDRIELTESDPYTPCAEIQIKVSPEAPIIQPKSGPPCKQFIEDMIVSCMSGGLHLPSGEDVRRHVLLNRLHDFSKRGTYIVSATRYLALFANWGKLYQPGGQISSTFIFTVSDPKSPEDIEASFTPFLTDLSSG